MTMLILLISSLTMVVRGCFKAADLLLALHDRVRAHFYPRGITSLDRGELITRPMVLIRFRGFITPVDDAMIAP